MRNIRNVLLVLILFSAPNLFGQGVPAPATYRLQPHLSGLSLPVFITSLRDNSNRLFVVQQRGLIRIVQPGTNTMTDFLNVSSVVSQSGNERGLLGLAFHPQYSTNRRFFIYYTRSTDGALEIAEYQRSVGNPNQADPTPVRTIITIPHPSFSNHNGGTILFGPDGYLYAGPGDGGSGNDPGNNAQNINSLLGKILRIDINTPVGQVPAYNIPPTNPYAGSIPGADEIYAVGMRNPYRFSFDRGGTNQLWAADVGQDAIEEVDIITLGGNYGWRVYEGTQCTNLDPGLCIPTNFTAPVFQYSSSGAGNPRCSITGGHVFRGLKNTFATGSYIYGDYCSGEIMLWNGATQNVLIDTSRLISAFGEDENGDLYLAGLTSGTVEKIVRAKASADFDGDLRSDVSVFRPGNGVWYINHSSNGTNRFHQFGVSGDIPVPEDFDGDNISDIAVFRPSNGAIYAFRSLDSTVMISASAAAADIPVIGDYDGDSRADLAFYRAAVNQWWVRRSSTNFQLSLYSFGSTGDQPVQADYDGDGSVDLAVFRPSTGQWWYSPSSIPAFGTFGVATWGLAGDVPVPGDYDGDGRADFAVFRPSTGVWYIRQSSNGSAAIYSWGLSNDIPAVGDYDGDGREDVAVFRPSTGVWYILRSSNSSFQFAQWGLDGDLPAATYDIP